MQKATVTFTPLSEEQKRGKSLNCSMLLPKGEIFIDANDKYVPG
jgi:hypothetical protein